MSVASDLVDAVVSAINAAALAGDLGGIGRKITAEKGYAPESGYEKLIGIKVFVSTGNPSRRPSTHDGTNLETRTARVVLITRMAGKEANDIEPLIALVELMLDEIQSRIASRTFMFLGADPETSDDFEENLLRNDAVFRSETNLEYQLLRQVA